MATKTFYTNNLEQILATFGIKKGVFDKINKNCPEFMDNFMQMIRSIVLLCIQKNDVAIGINYKTPYCFVLKRWVWELADKYDYGKYFEILGIRPDATNQNIGFSGFHNGSDNQLSATFIEGVLAHYINVCNGIDPAFSEAITYGMSKKSQSYALFVSPEFQNSMDNEALKNIAKNIAPWCKERNMIIGKYNKAIKRTKGYDYRINESYTKNFRKTRYKDGSVKSDLIDLNSGVGISLKMGKGAQLCSTSTEEWLCMLDYVKDVLNNPELNKELDHLYNITDYSKVCHKKFGSTITAIKNNVKHKYHEEVMLMVSYHRYLTAEIDKICMKFPEFRKALYEDALTGKSKYQAGSSAIPTYILHFDPQNADNWEMLTVGEFLDKHLNDLSPTFGFKSTTGSAPAYTSFRIAFYAKKTS